MSCSDFFFILPANITVLFVWFNTTFVYDYSKLFGLNSLFKEYEKTPPDMMLPVYLYMNRERLSKGNRVLYFVIKLTTCVFCLGFWTSCIFCVSLSQMTMIPLIYITTLIVYGIITKLIYKH